MSNGRRDGAFLLVAADVDVVVIGPAIGQPMDQRGIAVKGEDHGRARGEERIEVGIAQAMGMRGWRLQPHEIDDIHDAHLQGRQVLAQDRDRGERFEGRHVAAAGHHHIGFAARVVARPLPDADAVGAMPSAADMDSHCGAGCFPAITTLT